VRFRALGATGAKWPALLFESLRDICGRFRSSRTRGRYSFECCRPYKPTLRLSLGRSRHFVWAPAPDITLSSGLFRKSVLAVRIHVAPPTSPSPFTFRPEMLEIRASFWPWLSPLRRCRHRPLRSRNQYLVNGRASVRACSGRHRVALLPARSRTCVLPRMRRGISRLEFSS
jgi:hypothetical protein